MDTIRSEGERKSKNYLEKGCSERAKQNRVEELGSSQSGSTRLKVLEAGSPYVPTGAMIHDDNDAVFIDLTKSFDTVFHEGL